MNVLSETIVVAKRCAVPGRVMPRSEGSAWMKTEDDRPTCRV
jgi:hypothetical protein